MVFNLHRANGEKAESYESLHRRMITDAQARGLRYQEMAVEFNKKDIRRRGGEPWKALNIMKTWSKLKRLERGRNRKGSMSRKESGAVVLKKSA